VALKASRSLRAFRASPRALVACFCRIAVFERLLGYALSHCLLFLAQFLVDDHASPFLPGMDAPGRADVRFFGILENFKIAPI
jgi:hypothetical protein